MKLKLSQVFAVSLLGLAGALALLFAVVDAASRQTLMESSERIRDGVGREVGERVAQFLDKAPAVARQIQLAARRGLVDPRDLASVEAVLFAPLLADADIGEVTLTFGEMEGFDEQGEIQLRPEGRGQLSVVRSARPHGAEAFWSRRVREEAGGFVEERRKLTDGKPLNQARWQREETSPSDPTRHLTFLTPASRDWYGELVPSDLHWSQLDLPTADARRPVEVSVQQVLTDADNRFVGVLRVGLLAQQLERAVQVRSAGDPHRVFLCDAAGRLITRGVSADEVVEFEDGLRLSPARLPAELKHALGHSARRESGGAASLQSGVFRVGGEDFLETFRALPGTQDWLVGIVVPRAFYLGKLTEIRRQLLLVSLAVIVVLVGAGGFILHAVQRAQAQIVRETAKMRALEFTPSSPQSAFRDIADVLMSLEQAKTAVRAMGKYVPIDLVRRLYRTESEPMLGGEHLEISIMFTDIRDFTSLSEKMAPNELAAALGDYLHVMARVLQQDFRGTIDKYIGDAIMTIWNAPEPVPGHATLACRAALQARAAAAALMATPAWGARPIFETRFGLHCDTAFVGHFGSPERLSYTAIGNGVNLASRLEGLNKQYGTSIIVSDAIRQRAGDEFCFRLLDFVAVKGKEEAVYLYELLDHGEKPAQVVKTYEDAFRAYQARDFAGAARLLAAQAAEDEPSRVLLARCAAWQQNPPPDGWQGIYAAAEK